MSRVEESKAVERKRQQQRERRRREAAAALTYLAALRRREAEPLPAAVRLLLARHARQDKEASSRSRQSAPAWAETRLRPAAQIAGSKKSAVPANAQPLLLKTGHPALKLLDEPPAFVRRCAADVLKAVAPHRRSSDSAEEKDERALKNAQDKQTEWSSAHIHEEPKPAVPQTAKLRPDKELPQARPFALRQHANDGQQARKSQDTDRQISQEQCRRWLLRVERAVAHERAIANRGGEESMRLTEQVRELAHPDAAREKQTQETSRSRDAHSQSLSPASLRKIAARLEKADQQSAELAKLRAAVATLVALRSQNARQHSEAEKASASAIAKHANGEFERDHPDQQSSPVEDSDDSLWPQLLDQLSQVLAGAQGPEAQQAAIARLFAPVLTTLQRNSAGHAAEREKVRLQLERKALQLERWAVREYDARLADHLHELLARERARLDRTFANASNNAAPSDSPDMRGETVFERQVRAV